jgi:hypothetical protein
MKKRIIFSLIFYVGIIISFSCDNELSSKVQTSIYQVPGCKSNSLFKTGIDNRDSCFTYSYTEKLTVDFCVDGNCCPDSNRYSISSKILRDSITITVADTAQNLCRCICNYIIHGEFESLPKDEYFIKCILKKEGNQEITYAQTVKRTRL